ncbi:hypothetical protein GCM10027290_49030 [Micromonospora sonneratiae]
MLPDRHVPLPPGTAGTPAATLTTGIAAWVDSEPVRDLVHAFGGRCPEGDLTGTLSWLDDFSAEHWDFRGGRERPDAREPDLAPRTVELVLAAARSLGMVEPAPPPHRVYQHLIVLGGLAHACLRRTGYAAHLLRSGLTVTGEVAVLGSFRPLTPAEQGNLATIDMTGCATEVDVLDTAVRLTFGHATPTESDGEDFSDEDTGTDAEPHCSWSVRSYLDDAGPPVRVLAAPSSEPAVRRAHTADTQRFWAGQARLSPGDRVLMVTAPIYVPFQHCDAVRTLGLPYGCGIDTVGVDPALTVAPLPEPTLTAGRYLQELRSAIRSMRALHSSIVSGPPVGDTLRR